MIRRTRFRNHANTRTGSVSNSVIITSFRWTDWGRRKATGQPVRRLRLSTAPLHAEPCSPVPRDAVFDRPASPPGKPRNHHARASFSGGMPRLQHGAWRGDHLRSSWFHTVAPPASATAPTCPQARIPSEISVIFSHYCTGAEQATSLSKEQVASMIAPICVTTIPKP